MTLRRVAGCPIHTRSLRMSGEESAQGSSFPSREPTTLPQPRILLFRKPQIAPPQPTRQAILEPLPRRQVLERVPMLRPLGTLPESPNANVLSSRRPSLTVMRRMARQTLGVKVSLGMAKRFFYKRYLVSPLALPYVSSTGLSTI